MVGDLKEPVPLLLYTLSKGMRKSPGPGSTGSCFDAIPMGIEGAFAYFDLPISMEV
jgi:hypothetical protein